MLELTTASSSREVCASARMHVCVCTVFLQSYVVLPPPSFAFFCGRASVNQVGFDVQPELGYTGTTEDRDTMFSLLYRFVFEAG